MIVNKLKTIFTSPWSKKHVGKLPVIFLLLGTLILLYPVVATLQNNASQKRVIDNYSAKTSTISQEKLQEQLKMAEQYNDNLRSSPLLDPWIDDKRPNSVEYKQYLTYLDTNEIMAYLTIPKIKVALPIYHGSDHEVLEKGVGHLYGTSLPVGGTSTHSVLTAHTGLGTATMFDNLVKMKKDDVFYVKVLNRKLKYKVVNIQVVKPNETESLEEVTGKDYVTLVTCTPYGVNTHRLFVTGERVPLDPATDTTVDKIDTTIFQPWMIVALVVSALVIIALLTRLVYVLVKKNKQRKASA